MAMNYWRVYLQDQANKARLLGFDSVEIPLELVDLSVIDDRSIANSLTSVASGSWDSKKASSIKIITIKELRALTGLSLKGAKDLIDERFKAIGYTPQ